MTTARLRGDTTPARVPGVVSLLLAVGCAVYVILAPVDDVVFWSTLVVALWFTLLGWKTIAGSADLSEPIHWINATYLVLFGLHPLSLHALGGIDAPYHGTFDISPTYASAVSTGLLSMTVVNIGYAVLARRRGPEPQPPGVARPGPPPAGPGIPAPGSVRRMRTAAWLLVLVGACGMVYLLSLGTDNENGSAGAGHTAYAYNLPYVLIPASLLFLAVYWCERKRADLLSGVLVALAYASILMTLGGRTPILLALSAPALFAVMQWRTRIPRAGVLLIAVLAVVGFAALRDANSPTSSLGESLSRSVTHPDEVLIQTFTGDDTEMVDALALEMRFVPGHFEHEPGIMVRSTLGAPIPRLIWPDKPKTADVVLNEVLFDRGANEASVAYSMVGEAYFDSGFLGVVAYGAALGALYGSLWHRRRTRSLSPLDTALVATATAMVPIVFRGILAYSLGIALFLFAPLVLVKLWNAAAERRARAETAAGSPIDLIRAAGGRLTPR
ncbi:O-antigen polymerase [Geodermatophilus sp. SYSU D00758]